MMGMTAVTMMTMTTMLVLVLGTTTTVTVTVAVTVTGFQFEQFQLSIPQQSPRRRIQIQQQQQQQQQPQRRRRRQQRHQSQHRLQFSPTSRTQPHSVFRILATTAATYSTSEEAPPPAASSPKTDQFGPNRGDANGAALLLEQVNVYRGSDRILDSIDWRVEPRSKWGLVGQNGCGKSTLLKAVMNEGAASYDGRIVVDNTQTVGYLQQTAVSGSTNTVFEEACDAMTEVTEAKIAFEAAELRVARHDDDDPGTTTTTSSSSSSSLEEDLELLDRAMTRYENVGGYTQHQTVNELLKGLGFSEHQLTMPCSDLSGGWQMRVSFAKLLLKRPSLALLDEPSNHLDRSARRWLANYLRKYEDGAMVLVTHDSELLSSCEHIAEIGPGGRLQIYKSCTYEQYLDLKQQRSASAMTEYEKNVKEAQRLQAFVDKYGASATKASAAQSRVKKIQKMKDLGLLDKPSVEILEVERFRPRLNLPPPPPVHRGSDGVPLLALQNDASIGYIDDDDDDSSSTHRLASNIHVEIHPGMKILIRGPNGAGKTTLLDTLRGTIPLLGGDRIENPSLRLGVFTQDLAQELDVTARAVDLVTAYARNGDDGDINISDQDARGVMGGLGLTGDKSLRLVGELSGGEKARVALAMFALKPSNLYLLDEVSNHLDVECVEALSEALSTWGEDTGSIIVISHDKAFCEQVGFTHVLTLDGKGGMKLEQREVRESDWDSSGGLSTAQSPPSQQTNEIEEPAEETVVLDDKQRKQAFNAPKRIAKIEVLVEEFEEKIAEIDQKMIEIGNDVGELVDLNNEKEKLQEKVATLMSEWEELEDLLALAAKAA